MKKPGLNVKAHVYHAAYHDFDNTIQDFKYWPNTVTSRRCPPSEINPVTFSEYKILKTGDIYKTYMAFTPVFNYKQCAARL